MNRQRDPMSTMHHECQPVEEANCHDGDKSIHSTTEKHYPIWTQHSGYTDKWQYLQGQANLQVQTKQAHAKHLSPNQHEDAYPHVVAYLPTPGTMEHQRSQQALSYQPGIQQQPILPVPGLPIATPGVTGTLFHPKLPQPFRLHHAHLHFDATVPLKNQMPTGQTPKPAALCKHIPSGTIVYRAYETSARAPHVAGLTNPSLQSSTMSANCSQPSVHLQANARLPAVQQQQQAPPKPMLNVQLHAPCVDARRSNSIDVASQSMSKPGTSFSHSMQTNDSKDHMDISANIGNPSTSGAIGVSYNDTNGELSMPIPIHNPLQQPTSSGPLPKLKSISRDGEFATSCGAPFVGLQTPQTCTPHSTTTALTPMVDHLDDTSSPGGPSGSNRNCQLSFLSAHAPKFVTPSNDAVPERECIEGFGIAGAAAPAAPAAPPVKVQGLSSLRIMDINSNGSPIGTSLRPKDSTLLQNYPVVPDEDIANLHSKKNDQANPRASIKLDIQQPQHRQSNRQSNEQESPKSANDSTWHGKAQETFGQRDENVAPPINAAQATFWGADQPTSKSKPHELPREKDVRPSFAAKCQKGAYVRLSVIRPLNLDDEGSLTTLPGKENCGSNGNRNSTCQWSSLSILPLRAHLGSGAMGQVFLVKLGNEHLALKIAVQSDSAACMYLRQGWTNLVRLETLHRCQQQQRRMRQMSSTIETSRNKARKTRTNLSRAGLAPGINCFGNEFCDDGENGFDDMLRDGRGENVAKRGLNVFDALQMGSLGKEAGYFTNMNRWKGKGDNSGFFPGQLVGDCTGGGGDGRYFCKPVAYLEGDWMHHPQNQKDAPESEASRIRTISTPKKCTTQPDSLVRTPICGYLMRFVPYSCQLTVLIWHLHRSVDRTGFNKRSREQPFARRMVSLAMHVAAAHRQIACDADLYAFDFNPKNILVSVVLPPGHRLSHRKTLSSLEITNLVFLEKEISFRVTAIDLDCSLRPPFSMASGDPLLLDWDAGRRVVYSCPHVSSLVSAYILSVLAKNKSQGQFTRSGLTDSAAHEAILQRINDPTNFLYYVVDTGMEDDSPRTCQEVASAGTSEQTMALPKWQQGQHQRYFYNGPNANVEPKLKSHEHTPKSRRVVVPCPNVNKKGTPLRAYDSNDENNVCSKRVINTHNFQPEDVETTERPCASKGNDQSFTCPSFQPLFLYPMHSSARHIASKDHWRYGVRLVHHHASLQLLAFVVCDLLEARSLHNVVLTYYGRFLRALGLPTDVSKIFSCNSQIISCLCFSALTRMHSNSIPPQAFSDNAAVGWATFSSIPRFPLESTHVSPSLASRVHTLLCSVWTNQRYWPWGPKDLTPFPPRLLPVGESDQLPLSSERLARLSWGNFGAVLQHRPSPKTPRNRPHIFGVGQHGLSVGSADSARHSRHNQRQAPREKAVENLKKWDKLHEKVPKAAAPKVSAPKAPDENPLPCSGLTSKNYHLLWNELKPQKDRQQSSLLLESCAWAASKDQQKIHAKSLPFSQLNGDNHQARQSATCMHAPLYHFEALQSLVSSGVCMEHFTLWQRLEMLPRVHPRQFLPAENIFGSDFSADVKDLNALFLILLDPLPHQLQEFESPRAVYDFLIHKFASLLQKLS